MPFLSNHFFKIFYSPCFLERQTDVFEQLFLYNYCLILFIERPIGILHLDLYFVYIDVSIVVAFFCVCQRYGHRDTNIQELLNSLTLAAYRCRFKDYLFSAPSPYLCPFFVYLDLESRVLLFFYLYLVSHGCLEFWHLIKTQWFSFTCLQFSTLFRFVPFKLRWDRIALNKLLNLILFAVFLQGFFIFIFHCLLDQQVCYILIGYFFT